MEVIAQVGEFLADSFLRLWTAVGTWGVIGFAIIAPAIIYRISRIMKKIFHF